MYSKGDMVKFRYDEKVITGKITVVDSFDIVGDNNKISYDIFSEENNCMYKHINEFYILEKC